MSSERRLRIFELLGAGQPALGTARLCEVCAQMTATTGAGITLSVDGIERSPVCTTDPVMDQIEELQFGLGEGPCIDAYREGRPVLEPDLVSPSAFRWISFGPAAVEAGARAVFGFPIRIGAVRLGALNLYRDRPGPLSDDEYADALVLADVAAEMIVLLQSEAPPGEVAAALQSDVSFHYIVHQASGMVSAQLDITVDHALARLRALAFSSGRPLVDVARGVVNRNLRFDPISGNGIDQ